jgi:predicted O-methyltransferase YrrM
MHVRAARAHLSGSGARLGVMDDQTWTAVDAWWTAALHSPDPTLEAATADSAAAGLPPIAVSAPLGKLLHLLAHGIGARRILEIGTLGGYSTIWLARALPPGGELITCEIDPAHAAVARANLERAGVAAVVDLREGPAVDTLAGLSGPFDLAFVDADKPSGADYFRECVRLSRPGGLIVVDNVVRGGKVVDEASTDGAVVGTRRLAAAVAAEPRVEATVVQTVGTKGYDGFLLARVR